jgi:hypothetical protein
VKARRNQQQRQQVKRMVFQFVKHGSLLFIGGLAESRLSVGSYYGHVRRKAQQVEREHQNDEDLQNCRNRRGQARDPLYTPKQQSKHDENDDEIYQ